MCICVYTFGYYKILNIVLCCCSSVPSHVQLFTTPRTAARHASLSRTISRSLSKFMSIESVMPSNHLVFCCPLLLLPSIFPSIRGFSNELAVTSSGQNIGVSVLASVLPMSEYSGLISFRIDWFYLLTVQRILKSLRQHHSLKAQFFELYSKSLLLIYFMCSNLCLFISYS